MTCAEVGSAERLAAQIDELTEVNTADILRAFGLERLRYGRALFARLCRGPARRFADHIVAYDEHVGAAGLQAGGSWLTRRYGGRLVVMGVEHVPTSGPLLVVANHPGLTDAVALFAALPRADLRVIALDRPFLRALPHTTSRLLLFSAGQRGRVSLLRAAARHLRAGGTLLTFPAGAIEPDPLVLPGAVESLAGWATSIGLLAQLAEGVTVVPAIVGGVIGPGALRHPLTKLRRAPADQRWLAAILHLLQPERYATTVRVAFGQPLRAEPGASIDTLRRAAIAEAQHLIETMRLKGL